MYKAEEAKLKSLVEPEVWELLKENKAIIAGGAITSLFTNSDVKDIDVYLPSERNIVNILAEAFSMEDFTETNDILSPFQLRYVNITDKSLMFKNNGQEVQLITFKYFDSAQETFDTFDFTCCMGAYDLDKEKFEFHPDFMKHNAQRYLKFHDGTAFPLASALRVEKYKDKGYSISKSEFLRIIFKCMTFNFTSWNEVKEHIGGMYGYNMDEFFDEEKEFSLEEVMNQIASKDYGFSQYKAVESEFLAVLTKFDSADEIEIMEPPYREGYFYKHVGSDLKSNHYHQKIEYLIGSVVNGGKEGIFIHADPIDPWTTKGICIELEALEGSRVEKSTATWDTRKATAYGDFRVIRIMPAWQPDLTKPEIKYLARKGENDV